MQGRSLKQCQMTYAEHVEIGERLKAIHNELQSIGIRVSNTYRKPDGACLHRALDLINRTRSWLEDRLFDEHKDQANLDVYYGPLRAQRAGTLVERKAGSNPFQTPGTAGTLEAGFPSENARSETLERLEREDRSVPTTFLGFRGWNGGHG